MIKRRKDGLVEGPLGHIVVPLMGRFKGEAGERNLLLVFANVTNSGLQVRKWVELLIALLMTENQQNIVGPAICDKRGIVLSMCTLNNLFHQLLETIQIEKPEMIPGDMIVADRYNLYCSFHQGATTRAQEHKVPGPIIKIHNRWRKVENNQGSLPRLPMSQLYLEISQVLDSKLRFSRALRKDKLVLKFIISYLHNLHILRTLFCYIDLF